MKKRKLMDEITNFIEYYTSDDAERQQMSDALLDYLLDVYQESSRDVYFTRQGEFYMVKSSDVTEFKIHANEKEFYMSKYLDLKYTVHVG